jgi:hypothetical protein
MRYNIKIDLKEEGWKALDWTNLVQNKVQWRALVATTKKLCIPCRTGNFLSGSNTARFLSRNLIHEVSKEKCQFNVTKPRKEKKEKKT